MAFPICKSLTDTVMLNQGVKMPTFGLGVFMSAAGDDGEAERACLTGLKIGYRYIDTAVFYQNEADVGRAVKKSGMKREDIFVTTKIWQDYHGYELAKQSMTSSLKKMDIDYIDQVLIHSPSGGLNIETYKAMAEFQQQGLVKSIGVSNFGIHHLQGLMESGLPKPCVNQIEFHPWFKRPDLVKFCHDNGIVVVGYCPIVRGQKFDDPEIVKLSKLLNKTPAQVLIRYSVQMGVITIPKSVKQKRLEENMQVFDFEIPQASMDILNSYEEEGITWDPVSSKWLG